MNMTSNMRSSAHNNLVCARGVYICGRKFDLWWSSRDYFPVLPSCSLSDSAVDRARDIIRYLLCKQRLEEEEAEAIKLRSVQTRLQLERIQQMVRDKSIWIDRMDLVNQEFLQNRAKQEALLSFEKRCIDERFNMPSKCVVHQVVRSWDSHSVMFSFLDHVESDMLTLYNFNIIPYLNEEDQLEVQRLGGLPEIFLKKVFVMSEIKTWSHSFNYLVHNLIVHRIKFAPVMANIFCNSLLVRSLPLARVYPELRSCILADLSYHGTTMETNDTLQGKLFSLILDQEFEIDDSDTTSTPDSLSIEVEDMSVSDHEYGTMGSPDSYNYDLDFLEHQSDLIDDKDVRKRDFKEKKKREKKRINKVIDSVVSLSKAERKRLLASLKQMEHQSGPIDDVIQAILPYFRKFPFLTKLIVEILRTAAGIYMSTTREQVIFHILSSVASLAIGSSESYIQVIRSLFLTEQSGLDFGTLLRDGVKSWKGFADSKVVDDIKKSIIVLVSLGFNGLKGLADHLPNMKELISDSSLLKLTSFDIVSYSLELILSLYERIRAVVETGCMSSFCCPLPNLRKLTDRYEAINAKFPHAMAGNLPEHFGQTIDDFDAEVRLVYRELTRLSRYCDKADRVYVNMYKLKLSEKIAELDYFHSTQPIRRAPYSLNLIGSSGVGKTNLVTIFAVALAQCYGFKPTKDSFHYRNANDEYFSGYSGHRIIVEDDKNATKATPGGVDENGMTIQIVNNAAMPLVMAAVEDKGRYTLKADMHIMTTNVADAQAAILSNEPGAVLRRSHHIVVEVKDEFKLGKTSMLDPSKCAGRPLEDNAWIFTILDVDIEAQAQNAAAKWQWRTVMHNGRLMSRVPIHDVMIYLRDSCMKHIEQQNNIVEGFAELLELTELCEHGSGPSICRICLDLPDPPTAVTHVNMGHTHVTRPDLTPGLQYQSSMVVVVFRWLFYSYMPWILVYLDFMKNFSASHWIATCFRRVAPCFLTPQNEYVFTNIIDNFMWNKSLLLYFSVYIPFYFSLFCVSCVFYGLYAPISCILFYDGIFGLSCRLVMRMYRRLEARGFRNFISDVIAQRTQHILEKKFYYGAVLAAVGGALACYKITRKPHFEEQGSVVGVPVSNGWSKPYVPPMVVDKKRETTTSEDLINSCMNRIAWVKLYKDGDTQGLPGNIFPIKSGAWLCPKHYFFHDDGSRRLHDFIDIRLNSHAVGSSQSRVPVDHNLIFPIDGGDYCVFFIASTVGLMRDMTPFFSDDHRDVSATYVYRQQDGNILAGDTKVRLKYEVRTSLGQVYVTECPFVTFVGLCGAVQISNTKYPSIVSIHTHGSSGKSTAACTPIFKSQLMAALDLMFADEFTIQTGSMEFMDFTDGDSTKIISSDIHDKSPFNHLNEGSFIYWGRLAERSKPISTVVNTAICETVKSEFGIENIYGNPSYLRGWQPYYAAVENLVKPCHKDPLIWREAISMQHSTILESLQRCDLLHAQPLDELTILSGLDGDDMMKHMDLKTSSGYPYRMLKSDFITASYHPEDDKHQWYFEMNEFARRRIKDVEDRCADGKRPNCIFSANLKVEPKALFTQDADGKLEPKVSMPRVFYACPFELIYLMRKYFMPILKIIMLCDACEMSIGINAMGPDWGVLATKLLKVSDFILEADQSKFDQSVTPDELIPQYRFWIRIAQLCGYSCRDLRIMSVLVGCIIMPIIDFNSDLVTFYTLAISGSFGTAQMNSEVNASRFRAFFVFLYSCDMQFSTIIDAELKESKSLAKVYRKHVCANFFGDDSLVAVSKYISSKFNMVGFEKFMLSQGVVVTSASKGAIDKELMHITDVDYLKRSFRFDCERKVWTAPLNEKSIYKRLMVLIPSKVLTHEEQCAEAIENSLRDYFEYGREVFDEKREKLLRVAVKHSLLTHISRFHTYDQLVADYNDKYKTPPAAVRE